MKKTTTLLLTVMIASALVLGACNLPEKQAQADADATTVAETAAAVFTRAAETAAVTVPSATPMPLNPATVTPIPSNTPFPTQGPTATNTPIPCNRAAFVKDVTISDNTAVDANAVFTKTWRLKNTGSCSWTSGYVLLFDNGDQMNAPATASITSGTVAPGSTIDISVELTAPSTPGTYQGNFKLRSPDNIVFGINADGQGPFWVKVVVASPTATPTATATAVPFTVTGASLSASGSCGSFTIQADITANGAGNVTYKWIRSDGATDTATHPDVVFAFAGTQSVTTSWAVSASGSYWMDIYIISPNNQQFGRATFSCP